jgi:NTE family protein
MDLPGVTDTSLSATLRGAPISLALQGGGAHGAFTWGVLDRLLEDDGPDIAAISGTSAGALNAAALKAGMVAGGRMAARKRLDQLWDRVGDVGDLRLVPWMAAMLPLWQNWQSMASAFFPVSAQGLAAQLYSPYAWGDAWSNPLEPLLHDLDFASVCASDAPRLFVGATNVRSGKIKIFEGADITIEALMASACLPTVFQAVTIGTETYWDGGYTGNPALFPLYEPSLPDDVVIVSINPLYRDQVPDTPLEIQNRINEISFNSSLLGELRAIDFVKRLIAKGQMEPGAMKDVRVHMISDDTLMNELTAATKLAPSPQLLDRLKQAGRAAAHVFIVEHGEKVGRQSSVKLPEVYR